MAKKKPSNDSKEKREEILGVARRLFIETGYDLTSMSRIAEEAGVAPNTIYWYFADKDALLIAVLNSVLIDGLREFQGRKKLRPDRQLVWLLSVLESAHSLIATVHARLTVSDAVRVWHENFHRVAETTVQMELRRSGMPAGELASAARVYLFVVEGLLAHPTPTTERQAIAKWFVSALGKRSAQHARSGRA